MSNRPSAVAVVGSAMCVVIHRSTIEKWHNRRAVLDIPSRPGLSSCVIGSRADQMIKGIGQDVHYGKKPTDAMG